VGDEWAVTRSSLEPAAISTAVFRAAKSIPYLDAARFQAVEMHSLYEIRVPEECCRAGKSSSQVRRLVSLPLLARDA
jgi:hypothetical protein